MTNELSVESIRELLGKVTKGILTVYHGDNHFSIQNDKREIFCVVPEWSQGTIDSVFIAQSKTIVEFLLKEVERLEKELTNTCLEGKGL